MATLVIGTALALVALAFVLQPIFTDAGNAPRNSAPRREPTDTERAVDALREVEFDRATGKLSDDDYIALRAAYTAEAVQAMRAAPVTDGPGEAADAAEALIARYRGAVVDCATCGERPEPAAVFCSSCGARLAG
jgi:hypothetical protein